MQVAGRSRSTDGAAGLGLAGCPGPRSAAAASECPGAAPGCVRPFPALGRPRAPGAAVRGAASPPPRSWGCVERGEWGKSPIGRPQRGVEPLDGLAPAGSGCRAVGLPSGELRFGWWRRLCAFCLALQQEIAFRGFFMPVPFYNYR